MFKKLYLLVAIIFFIMPAYSNSNFEIAAVVGEEAISSVDVEDRLKLAIVSSGLPPTAEVQQRMLPQILQVLIDEKLVEQESKRLEIEVPKEELDYAIRSLEKKNNIEKGGFDDFLKNKGIKKETVVKQLTAQLQRNKIVSKSIQPKITITEKEVDEKMEHISSESGIEEVNISEIVLPIDGKENNDSTYKLALNLYDEIKQGKDFSSIARSFSRSSSAPTGGTIGWVNLMDLEKTMKNSIEGLQVGEISSPIKIEDSYYLIQLNDRRALIENSSEDYEIGLKQIFIPVKDDINKEDKNLLINSLNKAKNKINSCDGFDLLAKKVNSNISPKMVMVQIKSLNKTVQDVVKNAAIGVPTKNIENAEGIYTFMVCERIQSTKSLAERKQIKEMIFNRKLELQSRQFFRNLRRDTFIEIRL